MPLPVISVPTGTVTLPGGDTVSVRGLTRGEAIRIAKLDSSEEIERLCLELGTDQARATSDAWYDATPSEAVESVIKMVMELSGLGENGARPTSEA